MEEIKEVRITSSEKDVNDLLKKGYIIKKIIQTRINGDNDLQATFILVK